MGNKILVIVDMQNDFIDGALANPAAKAIVPGIIDLLDNEEFDKIICTLDTHENDYLSTVEGKNLPVQHCLRYTEGWCLNKDIRNRLDKVIDVEKMHHSFISLQMTKITAGLNGEDVDASYWLDDTKKRHFEVRGKYKFIEKNTFGSLDLMNEINTGDEIYFVGTCTAVCVINNVAIVKAAYPNNKITVYEDLCACVTPESHNRAIEQMKFNHINIEKWRN